MRERESVCVCADGAVVQIFNIQNDPDELENIRGEIAVMRCVTITCEDDTDTPVLTSAYSQIFHPNVVLFMGASTDPKEKLMIVTERLPSDLQTLLIENRNKVLALLCFL